jgi:putative toxin-antitoxin system antitoxin component (TIGR02293 family)
MPENKHNSAGVEKGTGEVRVMKLPIRSRVKRRGLGRICDLLGIDTVRNDVEFLRLVEQGLPTSSVQALARRVQEANLPVTEITETVIPRRTLDHRRKGKQPLTRDESDKLVRVARIVALSEEVFANRMKAVWWLRGPKPGLGGETPLAALATETGARLVETMLHQIDHGITA